MKTRAVFTANVVPAMKEVAAVAIANRMAARKGFESMRLFDFILNDVFRKVVVGWTRRNRFIL